MPTQLTIEPQCSIAGLDLSPADSCISKPDVPTSNQSSPRALYGLDAILRGACIALVGWMATALAVESDTGIITLKSGRTYHVYGEILVPVDAPPGPKSALKGTRWPAATLFYAFDSSVTATEQSDFRQWAPQWQIGSGVRLVEDPSAANRVLVQRGGLMDCGQSSIGMIGGVQDLVIDTDANCWSSNVAQHELGHALDAVHEQQRTDRDAYVTITDHGIIDQCGQGAWDANFGEVATETSTAYDYASIMHYMSPAYYVCNGMDVWADITVLQAQPQGAPAGSENVCTSAADCQAIIGSPTISARDQFGMALRYGYRIVVTRGGNGSGQVGVSGFQETCGADCYMSLPNSVLTVNAFPDVGSIASISGPCHGQIAVLFATFTTAVTPNANTGNGTLTVSVVGPEVVAGTYTVVCIKIRSNGGIFELRDAGGAVLAEANTGTPLESGYLTLAIADGSSDFIVDDSFTVTVTPSSSLAEYDFGDDAVQVAWGVLARDVDTTAGAAEQFAVVAGPAIVDSINFVNRHSVDVGLYNETILLSIEQLSRRAIIVREPAPVTVVT